MSSFLVESPLAQVRRGNRWCWILEFSEWRLEEIEFRVESSKFAELDCVLSFSFIVLINSLPFAIEFLCERIDFVIGNLSKLKTIYLPSSKAICRIKLYTLHGCLSISAWVNILSTSFSTHTKGRKSFLIRSFFCLDNKSITNFPYRFYIQLASIGK